MQLKTENSLPGVSAVRGINALIFTATAKAGIVS